MNFNQFTFRTDPILFAEFATPEQAQEAASKLNDRPSLGQEAVGAEIVSPDFQWDMSSFAPELYWKQACGPEGISKAVTPLLEQRRVVFSVIPPGWAGLNQKVSIRNAHNRQVVINSLRKYGVDSVGPAGVNWGDKAQKPKFLCLVDFTTREGAEQAIKDLDKQMVEGKEVGLRLATVGIRKGHRIGKLDRGLLKQLQEKQLAPEGVDDDLLSRPLPEFFAKGFDGNHPDALRRVKSRNQESRR